MWAHNFVFPENIIRLGLLGDFGFFDALQPLNVSCEVGVQSRINWGVVDGYKGSNGWWTA